MKGDVLADKKIKTMFRDFVFAELYTDRGTPVDDENQRLRIDTYGGALPLYFVLDEEGGVLSRLEGTASVGEFSGFLQKGLDAYRRRGVQ